MAVDLLLVPEAQQDVAETYNWYEDRRTGLGEEFLSCVEARIEEIRRTPELYPKVYEDFRRALVRRFPYEIFYEFSAEKVIIYSIFHASRDPNKWRSRLA